jgi:TonB family protein
VLVTDTPSVRGPAQGIAEQFQAGPGQGLLTQDTSRIYDPSELDRMPRLNNAATVASVMERLYPRMLQDAGIAGTVVVEFVIERDGTVQPATIQVIESPHEQLGVATRAALDRFRFSPGQVDGVNVRTRTRMPITWQPPVPRPDPPAGQAPGEALEVLMERLGAAVDAAALNQGQVAATPAGSRDTTPATAYEVAVLSRPPRLSNPTEVREDMALLYPADLRAAGVGGSVIAQFVIGADGRPDPRTIRIIQSPNPGLDQVTTTVVQRMRFSPGQFEGRDVRVVTQMPITWQP